MAYDAHDEAWDDFHARLSEELYPEHRDHAITEFTSDRLRSFYIKNPKLMAPAFDMYYEAKMLVKHERPTPAVVFFMATLELLLKAALLKPIVYGLVHNDGLAGLIVEHALGQTGFDRYKGLLAKIFENITKIDISTVKRPNTSSPLLDEAVDLQRLRNKIIHQGATCSASDALRAEEIVEVAFESIVNPILSTLGLASKPSGNGEITGV